jgi:hypothetical protein
MMLDWEGYRQELLERIGALGRLTPQTVRGYRELSDAGNRPRISTGRPGNSSRSPSE